MKEHDAYFAPENRGEVKEYRSPSGAYRLEIASFKTEAGAWNYI